jgi:hypothetical protein
MAARSTAGADRPDTTPREQTAAGAAAPVAPGADLYGRLAAAFDNTFKDFRGGIELEYITGEQCISRLNETLGVGSWSFVIREHGIQAEADEAWVLGELSAEIEGRTVLRQQFGSQKIKRSRSHGTPLDIGFDLKGAATDALKKCASLVGVGLYLSRKELPQALPNGSSGPVLLPERGGAAESGESGGGADSAGLTCADCGKELTETRFRDGTVWPPAQLAGYGRRKHSRVLCMEHYRSANEARRRSERALEEVPF